jgi:3-phenylpropionate/trans-cinnamate dioxygenase ferredoxin subunit
MHVIPYQGYAACRPIQDRVSRQTPRLRENSNHRPFQELLTMPERITIARTEDVPSGCGLAVNVEGLHIAVFNVGGTYYAIDDTCTHAEASLAEGDIDGTTVECALHGARFDLITGEAVGPPADRPVTAYRVHVEDGEIQIEVE